MAANDFIDELIDQLGPDVVRTSLEQREAYRYDRARDPRAQLPLAAVLPRTVEQVQTTLRWASAHRIPVTPRGAGTGLSGGADGLDGGIVLSLERMTAIEIDPATRTARAEPGALNVAVKQAAAEHGLWYPPDPSSYEISSIGGNVATNAGGLCCVKYGVTMDYVLGLDVVLADGRLVTFGGPRAKDVTGLPLAKLMVGSEGTLGVVTAVIAKLTPPLAPPATLVATFADVTQAARAVVQMCRDCKPSMVELMDNASINAVEDNLKMGLDRGAGALLLVQSDAAGQSRQLEMDLVRAACQDAGATDVVDTDDPDDGVLFVAARRAVLPSLERLGACLLEDVGVPVPRLPELLGGVEKIAAELGLAIPTVAHAGDGNAHPVIVHDPSDPDQQERVQRAFARIIELALSLDGTITGEHGVGRIKQPMVRAQLGDDVVDLQHAIKAAFDPLGILNPGAGY
ncbi:FAD-binding oxidoreductase [Calidifontibacter terrae]